MRSKLVLVLAVNALIACTSDQFDYGVSSTGGNPNCDTDPCPGECPTGQKLAAGGTCEPVCVPWHANVQMPFPSGLVALGSSVYAVGTSAEDDGRPPQGMVQRAESCGGKLATTDLPLSDKGSSADAVAASGTKLVVAGLSEGKVTVADLESKTTFTAGLLPADAVVTDAAANAAGAWIVGSSKTAGAWYAHLASGKLCSALLPGVAEASGVAAEQGTALVVESVAGKLRLARLDAGACSAPSFTSNELVLPGVDAATARDLLVIDQTAYVVGHARTGAAEPFGFVASVEIASGNLSAFVKWDLGPGVEVLHAVTAVGSTLYAGGVAGAKTPDDETTGSAWIHGFSLPLKAEAKPSYAEKREAQRVRSLAGGAETVFALGSSGAGSSVIWSFAAVSPSPG